MTVSRNLVAPSDEPEALLARGMQLPPQPAALLALQALAASGDPDMREVAEVISRDAALTAGLYRMARSPLFARRTPPQTVEQVVLLMGVPRALVLAQALCVQSSLPGDARVLARFWVRSGAIAQLAMLLAERLPGAHRVTSDQAYLVGMFHDCGVPILMQRFPAYCSSTGLAGMAKKWADVRTEDRLFSCDHAVIGFLLAKHWRLPDYVAQVVRFHHEGGRGPSRSVNVLVSLLQVAMHLYALEMDMQEREEDFKRVEVLQSLEISGCEFDDFCEQVLEDFHLLER